MQISARNSPRLLFDEATSLREFCSSEYARSILPNTAISGSVPPAIDLEAEARLIEALVTLAGQGLLASAHDLSDGGLAVALAECAFGSDGLGAVADVQTGGPAAFDLFGETGARAIVTCPESALADLLRDASKCRVTARTIGRVTRGDFHLRHNGATIIRDTVENLRHIWTGALERAVLGSDAVEHSAPGLPASNHQDRG